MPFGRGCDNIGIDFAEEPVMYKILRIVFCCLSAACVAVTIFILAFYGLWGFIVAAAAVVFFFIMKYFKGKQEAQEREKNPPPPIGDFITGRVSLHGDGTNGMADGAVDEAFGADGANDGGAGNEADGADGKAKN